MAGLVAAGVLGVTAVGASVVVAVAVLAGAFAPGPGVGVFLLALLATLAAGVAATVLSVGLAWTALDWLRSAVGRSRRRMLWGVYRRARSFEEETLPGRLLRPSRVFEGQGEDERDGPLVTELKTRYVAGELDELTFERELARLLGDRSRARRTVEVTAADGGRSAGGAGGGRGAGDAGDGGADDEAEGDRGRERERERERA